MSVLETGQIELVPCAVIPKRQIKAATMADTGVPCQIIQPD